MSQELEPRIGVPAHGEGFSVNPYMISDGVPAIGERGHS